MIKLFICMCKEKKIEQVVDGDVNSTWYVDCEMR